MILSFSEYERLLVDAAIAKFAMTLFFACCYLLSDIILPSQNNRASAKRKQLLCAITVSLALLCYFVLPACQILLDVSQDSYITAHGKCDYTGPLDKAWHGEVMFVKDEDGKKLHLSTPYSSINSVVRRIRGDSDYYLPAGLYEGTVVYGKHSHYILYFAPDDPDQMPDYNNT